MRISRLLIPATLAALLVPAFASPAAAEAKPASPWTLWFTQPAAKWDDALPVGSGRLGAMVFGRTADERIQFNEDTLWTGHPHDYVRKGSAEALPEVRKLLAEGHVRQATTLARARLLSDPVRQKAYQPFGDLHLHFPGIAAVSSYRRELDLETAVARTQFDANGVTYTRDVFASYPDNVIVVHLTASRPGSITFDLSLTSPQKDSSTTAGGNQPTLTLSGSVQPDGLRFQARALLMTSGGQVTSDAASLHVAGADSATILLVAATSFRNFQDISADPVARCARYLAALPTARPESAAYASLLARHEKDHETLFNRVHIDLGTSPAAALPTDERIRRLKSEGGLDADPALAALYFQYGRYLLISSSRPGSQPANLQGIWNELLNPPWECKWTLNINAEMNYWPAEVTNLSECTQPLFDLISDLTISGARTAREEYRARGWVVHHNTDLWRGSAPINNIDGIWPTGGAWLCYHLWEHWLFTHDRRFLAKEAYPAMRGASLFFVDSLQRDARTGWLVTSPSFSPEQGGLTRGPTMDNQLIRSLWEDTIAASRILGTDKKFAAQLATLLPQLPPNQVGRYGQLQEWLTDIDRPNNNHRHMSPLWALYPGADITPADPRIFNAAKVLLRWRGDGSTGWSYAWRMGLWARVNDGAMAYRQLSLLLERRTLTNLFDLCGPFQIDGNFGATAGIAEMLLQSQQRTPAGAVLIDLLPALPAAWPTGSITGLRARDGFVVDLTWSHGRLDRVHLLSLLGAPCRLRIGTRSIDLTTRQSEHLTFDGNLNPIR